MRAKKNRERVQRAQRRSHSGFSLLLVLSTVGCSSCDDPPDPAWCTASSTGPLTLDDVSTVDASSEDGLGTSQHALASGKGADTGATFTSAVRIDTKWSETVEKKHWRIWYWFHSGPDLVTETHGRNGSGVLIAKNLVLTTASLVKDGQPIEDRKQAGFLVKVHMPVLDKQITTPNPKPIIEKSGGFAVVDPSGADLALVFLEPSNSGKDKHYALPEMPVMYDWDETTKCCSKQHLMLVGHGDDGVRRSALAQVRGGSGDVDSIQLTGNGAQAGDIGAPWLAKLRMDQGTINPAYPWTIVGIHKGEVSGSTGLDDAPSERANRNSLVKIKKSTVEWIVQAVETENNRREESWYSYNYGSWGDDAEGDPKVSPDYVPLSDFDVGTPYTHKFTSLNDDCSNGSSGTFALGDGVCVGQEHTLKSVTQPLRDGTNSNGVTDTDGKGNSPAIGNISVQEEDKPRCTASLITENHVLTAAHCIVYYSRLDLTKADPNWGTRVFRFRTSEKAATWVDGWATVHPDYLATSPLSATSTSNDLAVVHLKSSISLKAPWGWKQLWPFNLPETYYMRLASNYTTCGNKVFIYGDGQRGPSDFDFSEGYSTLAFVGWWANSGDTSGKMFNFKAYSEPGMVRPGDSGGPTVVIRDTDGRPFQIGVHSVADGGSVTDTRLTQEKIDWIQKTINDDTSAPASWKGGKGSSPAKTVTAEMVGCASCGGEPKGI